MLPKEPDRDKTFWKVTNSKEYHHGLQYSTGLVIDPIPFNDNPNESCVEGGIYFTTKEYIHRFFWIGHNLRPVKYRADKLVFKEKKDLGYYFDYLFDRKTFPIDEYKYLAIRCPDYFDKWFDKDTFPKKDYQYLAEYCPDHFVKWLDKKTFPKEDYWYLERYCYKYKYIWKK